MSKKENVLFLCSWFPNRTNDTLGNFVEKHIETVAEQVNAFVFAYFSDENCNKFESVILKHNNIQTYLIYYPKIKGFFGIKQIKLIFVYLRILKKLIEFTKKNKFSIVHVNVAYPIGVFAYILKKIRKIPFVVSEHNTLYSKPKSEINFANRFVAKMTFNHANYILPVSLDLQHSIQKLTSNKNFSIVPNVVDTKLFKLKEKTNKSFYNFIHISTAKDQQKNVSGILEVFSEVFLEKTNYNLTIVSDGDLEPFKYLAERLKMNNNQINFIGKSTTLEIANFLRDSDAMVLFSNFENFPCVIPESFSVGIPVISTNVNGIPEYVNENNGILIAPKDKIALKNALLDFELKNHIFDSIKIRDYAEKHFSYEAVSDKIKTVYKQIIDVT